MKPVKTILTGLSALLLLGGLAACGPQAAEPDPSPAPSESTAAHAVTPQETPSASPEQPAAPESETPPQEPTPSDSLPEPEEPAEPSQQPTSSAPDGGETALTAYAAALRGLYYDRRYPNGDELFVYDNFTGEDLGLNLFAIYDVDRDGEDELLFLFTTGYTSAMQLTVYRYDPDFPGSLMVELAECPGITFYDNGVTRVLLSHNHSKGSEWPYFFYQYDEISDTYEYLAYVESWEKDLYPDDFPDELDADGDGIIYLYYIGTDPQYLDGPAYLEWYNSWLDGGQELNIPFQEFTAENIAALK